VDTSTGNPKDSKIELDILNWSKVIFKDLASNGQSFEQAAGFAYEHVSFHLAVCFTFLAQLQVYPGIE
jgi:hypothetical protein